MPIYTEFCPICHGTRRLPNGKLCKNCKDGFIQYQISEKSLKQKLKVRLADKI